MRAIDGVIGMKLRGGSERRAQLSLGAGFKLDYELDAKLERSGRRVQCWIDLFWAGYGPALQSECALPQAAECMHEWWPCVGCARLPPARLPPHRRADFVRLRGTQALQMLVERGYQYGCEMHQDGAWGFLRGGEGSRDALVQQRPAASEP